MVSSIERSLVPRPRSAGPLRFVTQVILGSGVSYAMQRFESFNNVQAHCSAAFYFPFPLPSRFNRTFLAIDVIGYAVVVFVVIVVCIAVGQPQNSSAIHRRRLAICVFPWTPPLFEVRAHGALSFSNPASVWVRV